MSNVAAKLLSVLEARDRRRLVFLFVAIVVMAVLEVAGIASIMPFMSLVADPGTLDEQPLLRRIYDAFGFESRQAFLVAAGAAVLVLLTVSNVFSAFTRWFQYKFSYDSAHALATRLLDTYLASPYAFFLTRNTSDMGKQVLAEVNSFINNLLYPATELCARIAVSACIFALLVAVDPVLAAIMLLVLGGAYLLIYSGVRRYLKRGGEVRVEAVRQRFKTATEALSGVKPIKVQGSEAYFSRRFEAASRDFSIVQARYNIIGEAPRYFIEILAFGGIIAVVLYLLTAGRGLQNVVPLLSLYALAGYRLLPSLQKLYKAFTNVRYFYPLIDAIHADLADTPVRPVFPAAPAEPMPFREVLTFEKVSYRYPGTEAPVLQDVDLRVPRGARVALVGATGSGKTTLVDLLMGLLTPGSGAVVVDGVPLTPERIDAWRRIVGYVPQDVFLVDDTVTRNIAFGITDPDPERVRAAARLAHIDDVIEALPGCYDTVIGERGIRLSGGQRQRLGLARAFFREPAVLVLDEATSALDGLTEEAVLQALDAQPGLTVVMIAHRLASVRHCDYIYLIEAGRVVDEGTYDALIEANDRFRGMARLPGLELAAPETAPAGGGA